MRYFLFLLPVLIWLCSASVQEKNTYLGASVDVFKFFGDLSMRLRTTPRNDTGQSWLFRDTLNYAFNYDSTLISSNNKTKISLKVELCDDLAALYSAFFRGIYIEGMDDSWRAFTSSWTSKLTARKLGISESHITQRRSYLLVMIDWYIHQTSLNLTDDSIIGELTERAAKFAELLRINETATLNNFIINIGSHYVSSYVIGDGLFQVYVFKEKSYKELKLMMKTPYFNIEKMINFFSTIYIKSAGHIMVKSGDNYLINWIRKIIKKESIGNIIYPSHLLEIYKQPILLKLIKNRINKKVLLKLNLKLLDNVFIDKYKKDWFKEAVDNRLKLYEINI